MRRILVTSALPYANGHIHIGHLVEYLQTDIWVRFQKLVGNECVYVCADDTHGTSVMIRARREGISEERLIAEMQAAHESDFAGFDIEFDNYGSTNSPETREACEQIWAEIRRAGLVEEREVTQLYDAEVGAFLADRFMHRLGLHGRAIIPLLSAVGCNVPAVMGTRVLSTRRERLIACALIVLIPCSARIAVIMGGVSRFVGVAYALLLFAVIVALVYLAGLLLNRMLPGESTGLVMEMFAFRAPSPTVVLKKTWQRIKDFLFVAAPLIVAGSVALGLLYETDAIVHLTAPLRPLAEWWLGIPGVALLALIMGFLRKELALALLVVLAARVIPGVSESSTLLDFMTRGQVFTFVLVCSVYLPCVATLGVLWRELGARGALAITGATVALAFLLGGLSHLVLILL